MDLANTFLSVCKIAWGTVPQYLVPAAIVGGFFWSSKQIKQARATRETENFLKVSDSTIEHNNSLLQDPLSKKYLQNLLKLNVPESEDGAKRYWVARGIHLSHINLSWRVWELAQKGQNINENYDGWVRFSREKIARELIESSIAVTNGDKSPEKLASSDLWIGLNNYDVFSQSYVIWLQKLIKEE